MFYVIKTRQINIRDFDTKGIYPE